MTPVLFRMKAEKLIGDAHKGLITKQKALNMLNGLKNQFNNDHPWDAGHTAHKTALNTEMDEAIKLAQRI